MSQSGGGGNWAVMQSPQSLANPAGLTWDSCAALSPTAVRGTGLRASASTGHWSQPAHQEGGAALGKAPLSHGARVIHRVG